MTPPDVLRARYKKSFEMQERFHELVPGGSHTYSKGEDQHPVLSPKIVTRAKGALCWDVDGHEYIDLMMGNRTFVLGHAYDKVDDAVVAALRQGTNFSRPGILEYELAEYLVDLWPVAEMVKFGKNGSDVTHAAIKLSRAYTGRDYIAKCGDHPFFCTQDWFISTTPCDNGIPATERGYSFNFRYNDIKSLEDLFAQHHNKIACVILEPVKDEEPRDNFLQKVKDLCAKNGAVLIFDEMISGIRFDLRGAHHRWGVYPDLACFGKCVSNGYSCSILAGRRDIMELGGIFHDKRRTFLLSQTHASETTGLAATMATLKECAAVDATQHIWDFGKKFKDGINNLARREGVDKYIGVKGFDCNPVFYFLDVRGAASLPLMTLFIQEALARGVMVSWLTFTYSHRQEHLDRAVEAFGEIMRTLKPVIENDGITANLTGDPIKPVMRTYNKCLQRICGEINGAAPMASCCARKK